MKTLLIASTLAVVAALSACKKEAEAPAPAPSSTMMSDNMAEMPMAGAMKHGMGAGMVTTIDAAKGTITVDHGAIAELQWPAMTMAFAVKPEQLSDIKVGDKVDFEIDWDGKTGTITKIAKSGQ
ncbi:copper-binding protein [Sphingobium fluviale]|jgi:Cu/Ag efflux protein CusF|uniref:Copper-binding protein n=1 Tax=Sphingobium fluviale TaxID=2506423 RepID=A0A4Q1KNN3_9SPHN|nr:copper-binding protein [Sphingobium fluviale]RXR31145.1 copper-binding protein [Sphingobium fluviale]